MNRSGSRLRGLNVPPPDGSRDPRIEDPSNRWVVHLLGRMLLPLALRAGVSANSVSIAGFLFGTAAAVCYFHWVYLWAAIAGLLLCIAWLVADGLDGMIARATGTTSATGRFLDGLCDHGVFVALYVALASSFGTAAAWTLAISAGVAHAVQSALYEGERVRFHRRIAGRRAAPERSARNSLVRLYDLVAGAPDRFSRSFDQWLDASGDSSSLRLSYGLSAVRPLGFMWVLSNNVRVVLIFASCVVGNPKLFWWIELVPLSLVALVGIAWHKRTEVTLFRNSILQRKPG